MHQNIWRFLFIGLHFFIFSIQANDQKTNFTYPVGFSEVEYFDEKRERPMVLSIFYPAALQDSLAKPHTFPFYTGFTAYKDAEVADNAKKYPLIVFSHGRGGNRFHLAWLAAFLASHGYIVASIDHYLANSYYSSYEYLASKIWERPLDISTNITYLLNNKKWGYYIDPDKIGVAGFSQGGFTALWVGGAKVNPEKFLIYQQNRRKDPLIPEFLRKRLPVFAEPALHVEDKRIKAVFSMAPGIIQAFGMDEAGLKELKIPTYLIVGEADTVTPFKDNASFAANHIPRATLHVIPGKVGHNIFVNECNEEGKNEFPDACIDDRTVDRRKTHQWIENEALKFFDSNLKVQIPQ